MCKKTSNLVDDGFPKCYNIINATHATTQRINYHITERTHVSKCPCFVNDDDHISANDMKDTHGWPMPSFMIPTTQWSHTHCTLGIVHNDNYISPTTDGLTDIAHLALCTMTIMSLPLQMASQTLYIWHCAQ